MRFKSLKYYHFALTVLIFLWTENVHAQEVWNSPKQTSQKAAKSLNKGKSKIKQWKQHIENWGMNDVYKHQLSVGGKLNSNGWSGGIYYLHKVEPDSKVLWQLTFSEVKHDKQVKQQKENKAFPELGEGTPFIFGKINNVYALQLGYGREQLLLPGIVEGNLSVSFRYSIGFSLAMLKPYYLKLLHVDYSQPNPIATMTEEKYVVGNAYFLDSKNILGSSKWSKGLNETKLIPGLFGELAFVIEPAHNKAFIETITLGANGSFYTKKLPVMADIKSYPYQACLFVGLSLGKKWR
jgi:hypothetical protein